MGHLSTSTIIDKYQVVKVSPGGSFSHLPPLKTKEAFGVRGGMFCDWEQDPSV